MNAIQYYVICTRAGANFSYMAQLQVQKIGIIVYGTLACGCSTAGGAVYHIFSIILFIIEVYTLIGIIL